MNLLYWTVGIFFALLCAVAAVLHIFLSPDFNPHLNRDARRVGAYLAAQNVCDHSLPIWPIDPVAGKYDFHPPTHNAFREAMKKAKEKENHRLKQLPVDELARFCMMGSANDTQPAPAAPARPASAWAGFAYGVITMSVLGGLFFFASQGSTERSEGGSPTGGNTMGSAASAPQTSAADDANLKALEEAVRKSPADVAQRIELVRAYLQRRDLMQVFDQTKAVLEIEPGNPHALTYQALVRVAMGQASQAETMLVEVIKKNPGIEDAYIHLAIARLQLGNKQGAEEAIQAGQKQFPEDKEQLARVFAQISAPSDEPGAEVPAEHPEVPPPAMGEGSGAAPPSSAQLVVVVDLPKGLTVPDTAILFVIVREAGLETGPPSAVKRVPAVNFPITVTVTEKDSMAGEGLPGLVRIDARVDRDGDPLSKDPQDPMASEENVRPGGAQVLLVLAPGKK